ncbi:MAG: 50S ribosomal protein L37ae [DPANN group archaeon]|nr:50S ribosomal protein L37ae [DPANN group archaeon]
MSGTKKVGSAGRFGSRYGRKIRVLVNNIENKSRGIYECPHCLKKSLSRENAGIWVCKSCKVKFTGGAYSPVTSASKVISQALAKLKSSI